MPTGDPPCNCGPCTCGPWWSVTPPPRCPHHCAQPPRWIAPATYAEPPLTEERAREIVREILNERRVSAADVARAVREILDEGARRGSVQINCIKTGTKEPT